MAKTLTQQQYLQAFALFTMARKHYAEMRRYEFALHDLLGIEDESKYMGCISDAIYSDDALSDLDEPLRREGFSVESAGETREE